MCICYVCYDPLCELECISLKCGHVLRLSCFQQAQNASQFSECPYCRSCIESPQQIFVQPSDICTADANNCSLMKMLHTRNEELKQELTNKLEEFDKIKIELLLTKAHYEQFKKKTLESIENDLFHEKLKLGVKLYRQEMVKMEQKYLTKLATEKKKYEMKLKKIGKEKNC